MSKSLYEIFTEVEDPRRKQGMRTTLPQIFCIITICNLCGQFGGRAVARFAKAHSQVFKKQLNLRHSIPSHVIFSDVLNRVDSKQLIKAFNKWAKYYVPLDKGENISGDGKALMSTVTNRNNANQKFEVVVSLFSQRSGLVKLLSKYENSKISELHVLTDMIEKLENCGLTIHADALHAKKNSKNDSR